MTAAAAVAGDEARIDSSVERDVTTLRLAGPWITRTAAPLDHDLAALVRKHPGGTVVLDLSGVSVLDTVGAWLVHRTQEDLATGGATVRVEGVSADQKGLLEAVSRVERDVPVKHPDRNILYDLALRTGKSTYHFRDEALALLSFLGMLVVKSLRALLHPGRIRFIALAHNIETTGLNAMPIVGLLSFLIGVVLAYQGADQLARFGAQIFVVNLLGVSVLRELGGLITAIIVAGRSGSAFTAQIGTMQVNQEVDAMETLGLDPIDVLVIPRVFALAITLPLLTFYASMMAIFGGALMSYFVLDISAAQFLQQFKAAIGVNTFWVGMVKAPVFAFAIAMVGCYEGLKVSGSAESVGRLTTQSVVVSIFLVIVLDALFSILFATLGI
ncbi:MULTISPECIES: ABC transporter permease [Inquilinus]|uniref:Phospholipid/cholesterol/gamma-HCH transport system permease protein n=1 Tax=Inquilinus ginsengisoli TaxID=363840 RepID=A0ABU1JVX2_9PROT|nr:MlaE family lipid ABC transporter permease subunit [Inquilinus ginsengisoli]MDR6292764.1 phospholipid/cholesterol/gamma-HCH transport system permease protein [Inquilinus ginsengisoli]